MELVSTCTQESGRTTVLQHWGGLQKDEEREEDQGPLGEELSGEREARQDGRVGMLTRQRRGTESVGLKMCRPYAPTGTGSLDDDEDNCVTTAYFQSYTSIRH